MARTEALARAKAASKQSPPRLRSGHNGSTLLAPETRTIQDGCPKRQASFEHPQRKTFSYGLRGLGDRVAMDPLPASVRAIRAIRSQEARTPK